MPIKEGEHAYVVFEDNINKNHGLWITRIPENNAVDARNLVLGSKKYEKESSRNDTSKIGLEKASQDTEIDVQKPKQSADFKIEEVPPFVFRVGDRAIEGSNNTLFLMSRDRVDSPDSGEKDKAGAIFLVAGRSKEKDLDLKEDKSILLISMMSDADGNMSIDAGDKAGAAAVIAAKSDEIRIVARKGMKIVVEQGDIYIKNDGKITLETTGDLDIKGGAKINIKGSSDITLKSDSKVILDCNNIEIGVGRRKSSSW